jgi:pyruvate/2-oxoglutarate/acetoin dehydrogenase E1 component
MRQLSYGDAIREATDQAMAADASVYVMGLGVTDPKAIFGTTAGLEGRYGSKRVMDMPVAENGMTGVAIGSALAGMRPLMIHQRIDFALLAVDQIVNNAAKWHYMFNGAQSVPLVIRLIVGRGWGQGPQHSQSLQATFGHVPGLKVVMPATPHDAKGLLIAAIEDPNPVIYIEHRWLHSTFGPVPEAYYTTPIGSCAIVRPGSDVTVACTSYGLLDALRAADALARDGIAAEIVDIRTVSPLDETTILASVLRTGRLVVVDTGWKSLGFAAEVVAMVSERAHGYLQAAPARVTAPDGYVPTSPGLADAYYPTALTVVNAVRATLALRPLTDAEAQLPVPAASDVPDAAFRGPF